MTVATRFCLLSGAAIAALALPASSYAADAAGAATVQELVVTAQKREENLRDVPQSVTAISGETLTLQRADTFQDYVTRVPGMNLVSAQAGTSRLVLRGINTGSVSATIGTYVDETPYGSVTALANGGVLAPDVDPFDMQRIEVLRGPQGTLYGASSLGGLLKFVTNAPDPSRYAGELDGDLEKTKSSDASGGVKGMVNVPIGDRIAVRAVGYYNDVPGFIDDPVRHATNVDSATYSGVRLSFLAKPIDQFTARFNILAQDIDSQGSSAVDLDPKTLEPVHGDLTQSRTFSPINKVDYRIYNATLDYDFGFANLLSSTSYATLHRDDQQDATVLLGGLLSAVFKQPLGSAIFDNLHHAKFTQELRLVSPAQKFEWMVGAFYTRETNALLQDLTAISLANPPQIPTGFNGLETVSLDSKYKEYAFFANVDYHFTDRFDVSLGGRYSHNDQNESQVTDGPLVGGKPSVVGGESSEGVFTFAVAPKYKLNDETTLYARVSKGYRPGGPNALQPLAPAAVPRTFDSDTLINYEVGVKGEAFASVSYDLTAFYIDWSNIQLLADVQNFGVNTNGGSAKSQGVEGSVAWAATSELTLSANAAYIDAQLTEDTPALTGGKKGDRLPYSAPFSGAVEANYRHELSGDMAMFLGGGVRWTGRRKSDFNTSIGQLSLPSYATVDLRGGIEMNHVRLEAYAKNLGDERGILSIGGFGATPDGAVEAGIIRPRTFGVAVSARF